MRKPFDLEEALAGKPVVTRNGEPVLKVVSFVGISTTAQFPIVYSTGGILYTCKADGRVYSGHTESPRDLFMEVEDEAIWTNIYRASDGMPYSRSYSTEEAADAASLIHANVRRGGKSYKVVLDGGTE